MENWQLLEDINCRDNLKMGPFFLNLKMERVWQRQYAN